jgi:DNA-binding transcriptional LysR family regulator
LIIAINVSDTSPERPLLPQLEAFLEVARRQNLSRAADALFVSQPTVTARLQNLEADLDEQLFVRTRRGMRLTEAGQAYLPYAERAVQALLDGRERLRELRRGSAGTLVLGAPPTVSTYTLPLLLAHFTAEHPSARLVVKTGTSEEILAMVLEDQVQVGLMRAVAHPEVESVAVYSDTLVLIAGPEHPLADRSRLRLAELAGETVVLFGRSSSYRDFTAAIFRQAGMLTGSVMELDNIEAAKKMVERGLGIALVPHSAVGAELARGSLRLIDLADAPTAKREIVAVRRRDAGRPSGTVAAFMRLLAELPELLAAEQSATAREPAGGA